MLTSLSGNLRATCIPSTTNTHPVRSRTYYVTRSDRPWTLGFRRRCFHVISAASKSDKKALQTQVCIIGSGPAAHTAAIYAARSELEPLLFEGFMANGIAPGGQLTTTTYVENFPGFPEPILGSELCENFRKQSIRNGVKVLTETVDNVDLSARPYKVCTEETEVEAETIIVATGAYARRLKFPGADTYWQKGISACAVCDGGIPAFRNQPLAVVGGGDVAMEEAIYLTRYASKVYVIHRFDYLEASKAMQHRALANPKIEIVWQHEVMDAYGDEDGFLGGITIRNNRTGETRCLPVLGLFFAIGHKPATSFLKGQLELDAGGYIITKPGSTETSVPGVFAAGDVQDRKYRQAITSAGTGCMAAIDAERFLAGVPSVSASTLDLESSNLRPSSGNTYGPPITTSTASHANIKPSTTKDANGHVLSAKDPNGRTSFTKDAKRQDSLHHAERQVASLTDTREHTSTSRDASGQIASITITSTRTSTSKDSSGDIYSVSIVDAQSPLSTSTSTVESGRSDRHLAASPNLSPFSTLPSVDIPDGLISSLPGTTVPGPCSPGATGLRTPKPAANLSVSIAKLKTYPVETAPKTGNRDSLTSYDNLANGFTTSTASTAGTASAVRTATTMNDCSTASSANVSDSTTESKASQQAVTGSAAAPSTGSGGAGASQGSKEESRNEVLCL